jgi:Protein of unknown function (DUF1553)/Protein of unknown function (DUF1549)/Planctomycete cytochrome C
MACLAVFGVLNGAEPESKPLSPETVKFFEERVRPVLVQRCQECHGPQKQRSGLRVDSAEALRKGGEHGPALADKPDDSLLLKVVSRGEPFAMPPREKLPEHERADLIAWIRMGSPWPASTIAVRPNPDKESPGFTAADRAFWAFQKPVEPKLPAVRDRAWVRTPIDQFILAGLEARGFPPAPAVDRRVLLRRITYDLTGLPPTPDEIEAFLKDTRADAYERVVERLLASPQYGERWGRYWLDVARYADSNGMDENLAFGNAWRYRDYVIAAFNKDRPYDQFLREQLAGDLMAIDADATVNTERLIATGFLSIGPKMLAEDDPVKMQMDIVDEQIDTVGRTFLGLTFGCARCHDHKFDPLPTADYYSLAGIFKSTKTMDNFSVVARWHEQPIPSTDDLEKQRRYQQTGAEKKGFLQDALAKLEKSALKIPEAMAVTEGTVANVRIHLRGNHLTLGAEVPRQFPRILAGEKQTPLDGKQSGRLQLAEWITRPDNPLTARVMVNRIWRGHFGQGLVRSPDNFGKLGERPDNPALLDWLAVRFVQSGWSIKAMHRLIVLSNTYRMSTAHNEKAALADPENRLYWRKDRRRLEAEAVRDALLAVSGQLDLRMGGSLLKTANRAYVAGTSSTNQATYDTRKRSVYLPVVRSALYDVFQAFDFADPSVPNGERATTTIAPQALFMMNSTLVQSASTKMALDLLGKTNQDDRERLGVLYERCFGRLPDERETERGLAFIKRMEAKYAEEKVPLVERRQKAWQSLCRVMLATNEFIYVE